MTRVFRKALQLPFPRKVIFTQVAVQLLLIHAGVRLFSFSTIYRFLKRFHRAPNLSHPDPARRETVCWAVNRAGRFLFADRGCLTQALLGETLLIRAGFPAKLCIGVRRQPDGSMLAHAWVDSAGKVAIGGQTRLSLKEFQNLPDLNQGLR
jgi:hypothetical protein